MKSLSRLVQQHHHVAATQRCHISSSSSSPSRIITRRPAFLERKRNDSNKQDDDDDDDNEGKNDANEPAPSLPTNSSKLSPQLLLSNNNKKPRASNPRIFQDRFRTVLLTGNIQNATPGGGTTDSRFGRMRRQGENTEKGEATRNAGIEPELARTLAEQLIASGQSVPNSSWVHIQNIPPISSLEAMVMGIEQALNAESERGILDLDAIWEHSDLPPFLLFENDVTSSSSSSWVLKARLLVSPFGRPNGWKLQFANRSIVHALLTYHAERPIQCAAKMVTVSECLDPTLDNDDNDNDTTNNAAILRTALLTDATIRVENVPDGTNALHLLNHFSRYDLVPKGTAIEQWKGLDGYDDPNNKEDDDAMNSIRKPTRSSLSTWLVHFADASWARAAMREKQASFLRRTSNNSSGDPLRLAQYPKQIL